jgi:hypothetical protein
VNKSRNSDQFVEFTHLPRVKEIHTSIIKDRELFSQISDHKLAVSRNRYTLNGRKIHPNHASGGKFFGNLNRPATCMLKIFHVRVT